jgi:hypothetical protein
MISETVIVNEQGQLIYKVDEQTSFPIEGPASNGCKWNLGVPKIKKKDE